jgi:hypothetical protein
MDQMRSCFQRVSILGAMVILLILPTAVAARMPRR